MKFLSRLISGMLKGVALVSGFNTTIGALAPKASNTIFHAETEITQIAGILTTVEAVGQVNGLSGEQKLKGAAPLVEQVFLQSSLLAGHKIDDEEKFKKACEGIASNLVDLINSLHPDGIDVEKRS